MNRPMWFSGVSRCRQQLIRTCQALNYGTVRQLRVDGGDPVPDSATLLAEERLDLPEEPRQEFNLKDLELCEEWRRLMARLDDIGSGIIERIEVRQGCGRGRQHRRRLQ